MTFNSVNKLLDELQVPLYNCFVYIWETIYIFLHDQLAIWSIKQTFVNKRLHFQNIQSTSLISWAQPTTRHKLSTKHS